MTDQLYNRWQQCHSHRRKSVINYFKIYKFSHEFSLASAFVKCWRSSSIKKLMRFASYIIFKKVTNIFQLFQNLLNNQYRLSHSENNWYRHWLYLIDRFSDQKLQQWWLWYRKHELLKWQHKYHVELISVNFYIHKFELWIL